LPNFHSLPIFRAGIFPTRAAWSTADRFIRRNEAAWSASITSATSSPSPVSGISTGSPEEPRRSRKPSCRSAKSNAARSSIGFVVTVASPDHGTTGDGRAGGLCFGLRPPVGASSFMSGPRFRAAFRVPILPRGNARSKIGPFAQFIMCSLCRVVRAVRLMGALAGRPDGHYIPYTT
jgi:hypothetical protein